MQRRSAALRIAKWTARMQQEAVSPIAQRRLVHATEKIATYISGVVGIEAQVRQVLEGKATGGVNIPTIATPYYYSFGRQCYKLQRGEFSGTSGNMACQNIKDVWVARGLDSATLKAIAAVFGYVIT